MIGTPFEKRRQDILQQAARRALTLPRLDSGLWFHGDIRDNVYWALHLEQAVSEGLAPREEGLAVADSVLRKVLALQVRRRCEICRFAVHAWMDVRRCRTARRR